MDTPDVIVVGGGPAGAVAALVAARAGARVCIVERASFPRDKLCGDTLNPGAIALLRRLGVASAIETRGLPVDGMLVTGEHDVTIHGRYPNGLLGRAIVRRELDAILLDAAVAAGCQVDHGIAVRRALIDDAGGAPRVRGVVVTTRAGERTLRAPVVIAADGRRSTLAFGLGLARHPSNPRRWAIGAYCNGVRPQTIADRHCLGSDPLQMRGEMHIRKNAYIGIAPVPGGLTNVCLVRPATAGDADFRDPASLLRNCLGSDPLLRERFAGAELVSAPVVLGPLAVDAMGVPPSGLLMAGDAAGFIDPMTGDGLRFAIRGGELAALSALKALEHGWVGVQQELAAARADAFAGKWRFNRGLRALVASPRAVGAAAFGARLAPGILRAVIARAGDCHIAA